MSNKINIEILMQIIIELFIASVLVFGLMTNRINIFVHPKFNLILYSSAIVLVIIAFFSSFQLFKPKHMNVLSRYFVIVIPLIMLLYMSGDIMAIMSTASSRDIVNQKESFVSVSPNLQQPEKRTVYAREKGKNYIEIDDEKYLKWYYDSTFNWSSYKGEKFRFLASVFKEDSQKGEFIVLGRMGMICCMADIQPCGFIYNEKGYEKLKNGEWYWVEGEIKENDKISFNHVQLPMIFNIKFEEANEPTDRFVYIQ